MIQKPPNIAKYPLKTPIFLSFVSSFGKEFTIAQKFITKKNNEPKKYTPKLHRCSNYVEIFKATQETHPKIPLLHKLCRNF